ncbi:MAG: ribosome maturation factor RimP [Thermoleophilia bacterium]|nr:ribosome maturation factor RimP [Thermoleophilia bacterium]
MTNVHDREKTLEREIAQEVEQSLPGTEVLAVELSGLERFTVFVDHPRGVDHALCERVTDVLRGYLDRYTVDVSSPGFERPLRKRAHFANAVGRRVSLRTPQRKRLRGEVVSAGERAVTLRAGEGNIEIPYDDIIRGNLIDERTTS